MAEILYRVGRFAAHRRWAVMGGWLVALVIGLITFVLFSGAISSAISIPDTPTSKVTDQLASEFESTSGGSGSVVFETTNGSAFTDPQKAAVADLLESIGQVEASPASPTRSPPRPSWRRAPPS